MGKHVGIVNYLAAQWAREADDAAKDLSSLICSAGLVIAVEQIWMWPDERVVEAQAWATRAAAAIAAGSAGIPQPPGWLLLEAQR